VPDRNVITEFYQNRTILLTGVTGFLGQAIAAKILRDLSQIRRLYVLVRSKTGRGGTALSAMERLEVEFFNSSVLDGFKRSAPEMYQRVRAKVVVVPGDISQQQLGVEDNLYADLQSEVDLVLNVAATVEFDAALDLSIELNTLGPQRMLEFIQGCRKEPVLVHVSTAYVNGCRTGSIPEEPLPMDRTIAQLETASAGDTFDPETEIKRCFDFCIGIRREASSSRMRELFESEVRHQNKARQVSDSRREKLVEGKAHRWIHDQLVSEGMRRAKGYGWNDIYTFTKAMGEQMLVKKRQSVPLVIVRPSIIESSLEDPEPGWISGLKVGDPLVIAYGKGVLPDFPARPDSALDMIPVDIVVNAVVGSPTQATADRVRVYQVATSGENPLLNATMFAYVREYFLDHPMHNKKGQVPVLKPLTLPSRRRFNRKIFVRYQFPVAVGQWLVDRLPNGLASNRVRRRLKAQKKRLERVMYYTNLFSPYTFLDCRFETKSLLAFFESLPPQEQQQFNMDVRCIRWEQYYKEIHLPGLRKHVLKEGNGADPLLADESTEATPAS
jgi:nucleoside-diphosphate-sugar epimerase